MIIFFYKAVGHRENYAVALQPHGMEFQLILLELPDYGIWTTEKEVEGFPRYYPLPTLLPISHNCPDPVPVNQQVSPALRDFHCVVISIFFFLHRIRIHIIILGINEQMEISSQLSPWNKIRLLSSWGESVREEYTFYFPLSNKMHFGSRLVLEWKEISCKSRKAVKVINIKKIVITAVDSKGICCFLQEVEQDVVSFKHCERASIFIVLRKYYIYIWGDAEQQNKTLV